MPQEQRPTEKFRTSVGGQALMEGIMMRGPEKICCAVRRPDGTIDLSYSDVTRSEERRVGKECRSRWSPYH